LSHLAKSETLLFVFGFFIETVLSQNQVELNCSVSLPLGEVRLGLNVELKNDLSHFIS